MRAFWALLLLSATAGVCCHAASARADQNVVVVLDDSGSMDGTMRTDSGRVQRIDAAKKALLSVLGNLPDDTNVGVLALNSQVAGSNWIVPFGPAQQGVWEANIQRIRAEGGTPLGQYLKMGADALLEARSQQVYGTYRLLVVTDGEANDPKVLSAYLPDLLSRGIIVDVIGVDMNSEHSLATRVHNYRRADDDSALQQAISEVFAESASTDDDTAEADFELISALPDGMAAEALQAIVNRGNQPLKSTASPNSGGSFSTKEISGTAGEVAIGALVCCLGAFASVFVLVVILFRSPSLPVAEDKRKTGSRCQLITAKRFVSIRSNAPDTFQAKTE